MLWFTVVALGIGFARLYVRVELEFVPRSKIDYYIHFRLMQMLPLPHLGDRQSLINSLSQVAPGRPLALFSVAHPPLLVIRRPGFHEPHTASGALIEAHLEELKAGQIVQDAICGTLIPAVTRYGDLRAAVVVADAQPVTLDAHAEGALRYVAGLLEYPSALHVWPHPLRPERECIRPTPVP